jgi:sialate O-acetylesterase
MRYYITIIFLLASIFTSRAQLATAKIFADHMVLQRNQQIPVWGWAEKNKRVTIVFNGQDVTAKADDQGYWKISLEPMTEGGPFTMEIFSGNEKLVYHDVMLGEVWICSGQSNMEFQLKNALGYKPEQQNSQTEPIRQFQVPDKISLDPLKDISGGQWIKADTNTVGNFTAVGYFFAKQLAEKLHVTVGLVYSNWGGTMVEDWISKDALLKSPDLGAATAALPTTFDGLSVRLDKKLKDYAYGKNPVTNYTAEQLAAEPGTFFSNWPKGNAPGSWEWMGFYSYRGAGFMQRTIKLDSTEAKNTSLLSLGITDGDLLLYINGKQIKPRAFSANHQVQLPPGTWQAGDNSMLIELLSAQKNPSWYGLGLNGAGNDLFIHFVDTAVNLADNTWRALPDLAKPYHFDYLPNNTAYLLYNSMVSPLIPYAMAGVIWYQGESNTTTAYQYRTAFPLLITDWRSRWGRDFPFLFVQISSFGGFQDSNIGSTWAELREAQTMTLQLPNTGMAVTTDIGEALNIHPKDKADVGLRLADKALTMVYKQTGFTESPEYKAADFSSGYATVSFTYADNGLVAKDKFGYIKGFELAGADHKFYYAQAQIVNGNKVKVWCDKVPQPIAVRYAWTDAPIDANLFNTEGFPVNSFRSDSWKGLTDEKKFE